jgi:ATP-dependent Lon protease
MLPMIEKLRNCFDEMVVYKDLKKSNFFSALSLPSFMRDWLLKRFEDENGNFDSDELMRFVRTYLPRKDDWTAIKNQVIIEHERVKFLAKVSIDIDIKTAEISFALPDFGLPGRDTIIEDSVWQTCKDDLVRGRETWGMIEIGYRPPDNYDVGAQKNKTSNRGKIKLTAFKTFCPYTIDVDYYKEARREFSTSEWIDVLLGAVDYNASGYLKKTKNADDRINSVEPEEKKLTMLTRLLPFVEKRLNLIELAPKGTGKSYLFGRVSRFGWLSSGGIMSRAKMFYDQNKQAVGLVLGNDFITLDEVQTISFTDADEMRAALKGYLESGIFTVGNYEGTADAGVILCGNIKKETMDADGYSNMFEELPSVFHESALIERFHGFIKGWNIPRMNDDLKIAGWALNSEYFCSILHELREDMGYRTVVDELIEVPEAADTRDTEAVKRIATAYLKLLFPNVREPDDITTREFKRYCLDRARKMRDTIKYQLGKLDDEYRGKDIPVFSVRSDPDEQER